MSFQDPMSKNIGVPTDDSPNRGALIFDNTYLSFMENTTCSINMKGNNGKLSEACNFCNKESLTCKSRRKNRNMFAFECRRFAKRLEYLVDILILQDPNKEASSKKLIKTFESKFTYNSDCHLEDLVKYLRKFTRKDTAVLG
jgi:hypothetical protein